MRLLRKRRNTTSAPQARAWDPFEAVPIIAEDVEVRSDPQGLIQIRKCAAPKSGLISALVHRLGMQPRLRVNLDEYGSEFWNRIDGARTLRDIEQLVREHTVYDRAESKKAIILFTKTLMKRHLIQLKLPMDITNREQI